VTKQAIHIIHSQPRDVIDDLSSISSQEGQGEPIRSPKTVNLSNPSNGTRAASTSLLRHDEEWNPSTISHIIPPHIRQNPMSKDKGESHLLFHHSSPQQFISDSKGNGKCNPTDNPSFGYTRSHSTLFDRSITMYL
jgi:hypothetical protein